MITVEDAVRTVCGILNFFGLHYVDLDVFRAARRGRGSEQEDDFLENILWRVLWDLLRLFVNDFCQTPASRKNGEEEVRYGGGDDRVIPAIRRREIAFLVHRLCGLDLRCRRWSSTGAGTDHDHHQAVLGEGKNVELEHSKSSPKRLLVGVGGVLDRLGVLEQYRRRRRQLMSSGSALQFWDVDETAGIFLRAVDTTAVELGGVLRELVDRARQRSEITVADDLQCTSDIVATSALHSEGFQTTQTGACGDTPPTTTALLPQHYTHFTRILASLEACDSQRVKLLQRLQNALGGTSSWGGNSNAGRGAPSKHGASSSSIGVPRQRPPSQLELFLLESTPTAFASHLKLLDLELELAALEQVEEKFFAWLAVLCEEEVEEDDEEYRRRDEEDLLHVEEGVVQSDAGVVADDDESCVAEEHLVANVAIAKILVQNRENFGPPVERERPLTELVDYVAHFRGECRQETKALEEVEADLEETLEGIWKSLAEQWGIRRL